MNKSKKKTILKIIAAAIIVIAALIIGRVFFLYFQKSAVDEINNNQPNKDMKELASENEHIDFNENDGLIYVNNELIVVAKEGIKPDEIEKIAASAGASVDSTMASIGIYKFIYSSPLTYEDLEKEIERIKKEPVVESVDFNIVSLTGEDASEDKEFEKKDSVYPDDDWGGAVWNEDAASGENWGMEAVEAPGAWGYLDQMDKVRIGLIDNLPNTDHPDLEYSSVDCILIDSKTGKTEINTQSVPADSIQHGTHVSGIMSALWNNGEGVSGMMGGKGELYYCETYINDNGEISKDYDTSYTYLLALKSLIDKDVQVINISQNTSRLVGFAASRGNENAINYLTRQANLAGTGLARIIKERTADEKKDFVICIAAGNSNNTEYYKDDSEPYGYREKPSAWETVKKCFGWSGEKGNSLALYNNFLNLISDNDVQDRIIVVGSTGIDYSKSLSTKTYYSYSNFSCVGSRVDVAAPGEDIYSCLGDGYDEMSGTSMATPHVSGIAGLVFACNSELNGAEVKRILCDSTVGRYYYYEGYCGMANARLAVENALQSTHEPVEKILKTTEDPALDLCFVVDTTGSMGDDIENARDNMTRILERLADKAPEYRVALIDYRDFPDRTGNSSDYPCRKQLGFTSKNERIIDAINNLDLGFGGDENETVFSALMEAVKLDWRQEAKKVIIILGDAGPHDPEPETGYTYDDVLTAIFNANIAIDYEESDSRVTDSIDSRLINVYSIGAEANEDVADFFNKLSSETGGSYSDVKHASGVSDAIIDSIDQIEMHKVVSVELNFGEEFANRKIDLFQGGKYLFTIQPDESGRFSLESVEPNSYKWRCQDNFSGGTIEVDRPNRLIEIEPANEYWFTPILNVWNNYKAIVIALYVLAVILLISIPKAVAVAGGAIKTKTDRSEADKTKYCPYCGKTIHANDKFCGKCGKRLE